MQRTIRILRVALPIAFLAFVVLIVLSWNRGHAAKDRTANEPITSSQRPQDKPQAESTTFEDTQTSGGRVVSHIVARRVVSFKSGWTTLEGVTLTLYRENGLTYELKCPEAQFNSETKEAEAQGGVRLTSSDGVEISTAKMHYDGTRLTNDIPVQFRIDRWSGNAGALDMDVESETLHLARTITAVMTPAVPAEPPTTIKAADAVFRRRENDVTFTQNVLMTRGADSVAADRIVGRFTQDRKRIVGMEGNGAVHMVMSGAPGPGETLGGRKTIDCERFFSEVGGDGQISAINAVSDAGMSHAVLEGPPARDIVAKSFRVALAGRSISGIKAEGQVEMKELGALPREVRADHVTVSFDPAQHRASSAFLEGFVKYHDPRTSASAVRANYDILNDVVVLTADPGFNPTVTTDGNVLKARQIEFSPKAGTAKASGEVIAQLVSKGGPAANSTNLFPGGQPVFVNADVLTLRQATKTAVFTGNVRAWQDINTLFAQELQVQGDGQIVTAKGNVRTSLYNIGSEQRKIPVTSRSDQLVARRNDRRIDLTGAVTIEDETRTMTSERATFFTDANRKVEHIEAETKVVLVEQSTSRRLTGDKATYDVRRKMVYISGAPARAITPRESASASEFVYDVARDRVQVRSPGGQSEFTFKDKP